MYSNPYGFPNGGPGGAPGPTFNGGTPPSQNPHMQPGPSPNQPQMMYNTQQQQYPMATQGHFSGASNPAAMMAAAGPAAMMQNPGISQMAPNGQMAYQAPFSGSPYGVGVPSTAPQPQFPPNYTVAGSMPHQFQGNPQQQHMQQQMQQQMQQRMYPSQQTGPNMGISTPQRQQFNNPRQATQSNLSPAQQQQQQLHHQQQQQPQPQPQSQAQQQPQPQQQQQHGQQQQSQQQGQKQQEQQGPLPGIPNQQGQIQNSTTGQQQSNPTSAITPQTPTFPATSQGPNTNGATATMTPLSPTATAREKERFDLVMDINKELLYETLQLTHTREELRKERLATMEANGNANGDESNATDEEKLVNQDYMHCMRRLQGNLSYLAGVADRKGNQHHPACPAILTAPPLHLNINLKPAPPIYPNATVPEPNEDRKERQLLLKELYEKLQALFPGFDPKKEPAYPVPANRPQPQAQQGGQRPGAPQNSDSTGTTAPGGQAGYMPQAAVAS